MECVCVCFLKKLQSCPFHTNSSRIIFGCRLSHDVTSSYVTWRQHGRAGSQPRLLCETVFIRGVIIINNNNNNTVCVKFYCTEIFLSSQGREYFFCWPTCEAREPLMSLFTKHHLPLSLARPGGNLIGCRWCQRGWTQIAPALYQGLKNWRGAMTTWCSCRVYDEDRPPRDHPERSHLFTPRSASTTCHTGTPKTAQSRRNQYVVSQCDSYWAQFIMLLWYLLLQLADIWGGIKGSWFPSGFTSLWNQYGVELNKKIKKQQNTECNHWSIEVRRALIHCWTNCTNSVKFRETYGSSRCPRSARQPDAGVEINFDPWMSQLPYTCISLSSMFILCMFVMPAAPVEVVIIYFFSYVYQFFIAVLSSVLRQAAEVLVLFLAFIPVQLPASKTSSSRPSKAPESAVWRTPTLPRRSRVPV